jgi:mevalonate kinase
MRTPEMARVEQAMMETGALGGKAAGSGAGGCMFFLVPEPKAGVAAAREAGATVLPVTWSADGVRAW